MGKSLPPKASFDLVGSFARRQGAEVEVVLADPIHPVLPGAEVVFSRAGVHVVGTCSWIDTDGGPGKLVVRAPRSGFGDGRWRLQLRHADDTRRLNARLLVQGDRPLVLLWGSKNLITDGASLRPRPRPRPVVVAGGSALDGALAVLPERIAGKVRAQVRTAVRKVVR